jgi:hypothetical protein
LVESVLKSTLLQGATQKHWAARQTGIELVPEVEREGKGAYDWTTSKKGMIMHTTTIAKIAAKLSIANWLEELSTSLASVRALAQPQWALSFAGRPRSKALAAGCGLSQSTQPFAMLVASDISKRSYGLVP